MAHNHILLIDDDDDDQEIFLAAMENVPLKVECTIIADAKEALAKLSNKDLEPDLIILDLNMPIMTGQQFLCEIKKHDTLRHIPVIVLSTSSNELTIEETKQLGALDFFTKPHKLNELTDILKKVITNK